MARDHLYTLSHRVRCHSQCQMGEGKKERKPDLSAGSGRARCELRRGVASRPAAGKRRVGGFLAAVWNKRACPVEEGTRWQGEEISVVLASLSTSSHSPYPHRRGCGPKGVCVRGLSRDTPASGRGCHCWLSCGPPGAGDPETAPSWVMPDEGPKA